MMKECVVCNTEFQPKTSQHKYCSKKCQPLKEYALKHYYKYRKLVNKNEKECGVCGNVFEGDKRRKYCSNKCSKKAVHMKRKAYDDKYISKPEVKEGKREKERAYRQTVEAKRKTNEAQNKRNRLPKYKVGISIRNTIHSSIRRKGITKRQWAKTKATFDTLGYTPMDLVKHLESQFTEDMSWENHGIDGWHIDHIRPVASFNYDSTEHPDFKKCWALNNLQPLWAKDNLSKGDKWDGIINR